MFQVMAFIGYLILSCDLLSNCIFDIDVSSKAGLLQVYWRCDLLSNCIFDIDVSSVGVTLISGESCDLLSNCIFDIDVSSVFGFQFLFRQL
jgi:hypothetical protein